MGHPFAPENKHAVIQSALEGVTVLDLTHYIAGPVATRLLAEYGADVIKVERRDGGDGSRRAGPFPGDEPHPEKSALFLHLNRGKRSVTLDLKEARGVEVVKRLAAKADILVENFHPRVMPSLGLSYDVLSKINPLLVMVSISDFGQTGPSKDYRGSEIVDYALGGPFYFTGLADRNPVKLGGSVVQYYAGVHAAAAAATAFMAATFRGEGDWVDVSIVEAQATSADRRTPMMAGYQYTGQINHRGSGAAPPVRPCADGYVNLQLGLAWWPRITEMLGRPDLLDDPRFCDPQESLKPENVDLQESLYLEWLLSRTMTEAWADAQRNRVLSGPIYAMKDVLADPHFRERDFWQRIDHPDAGPFEYPGLPFQTFGEPKQPARPAPRLGEHTREALGDLGYGEAEIDALARDGVI